MAIAHIQGLTTSNPFTLWRGITLAHPSVPHSLLLNVNADGKGFYQSTLRNFKKSDGRSLTGGIRISGAGYKPPEEWKINAIGTKTMRDLLEVLLAVQNSSAVPVSLIDEFEKAVYVSGAMNVPAWLTGYPVTGELGYPEGFAAYNVWLDVDAEWWSYLGGGRYLLQFDALQAI